MPAPQPIANSPIEPGRTSRRQLSWACLALVGLVIVAYVPTLSNEFVLFDDPQYVMENPLVRQPSWTSVRRFFTEIRKPSTVAGYYQPLTMVSLMFDGVLFHGRADPFVCHLHNIVLHAIMSALVFLFLRRFVGVSAIPWIVAALFAIHPANVESVAWISQRKTVLASPLALGCLLTYLHYGETKQKSALVASITLYLLANLAKPTIVLLPLVLPLLDWWPLRRNVRSALVEKWPFALIMVVMGTIAAVSQASSPATMGVPNLASTAVLLKWLALLSYNLMLYLGNVVWPLYLAPFRAVPESLALTHTPILLSLLGTAAVVAIWLFARRRYPPLFVGLAGFGITLALAMGPVRFFDSCVADRFLYFPLVMLLIPVATAIADIEALSKRRRRLLRYAMPLLAVPLFILTRAQQTIWRDGKTFWTHVLSALPDYGVAHTMLGLIYLQEQDFDAAMDHAVKANRYRPGEADAVALLGRVHLQRGHADEAVQYLQNAVTKKLNPDAGIAYVALGEALIVKGDFAAAQAAVEKAITLSSPAGAAYERLGDAALRFAKRFDLAAACYRKAVEHEPDNLTARWNLGTSLEALGNLAGALDAYEQTLARYARLDQPAPELQAAVERLRAKRATANATTAPASKPSQ